MRAAEGMRRLVLILLVALPGIALGSGEVDFDPYRWLDRMGEAVTRLDYEGTFVYIHDDQLEAMRVVHRSDDGRERERLVALSGARREIVRDEDRVMCYLPDEGRLLVEGRGDLHPLRDTLPDHSERLDRSYEFTDLGRDRVAGRETQVLGIEPEDEFRYGYRLWFDVETGMPLKSDLVGPDGRTIEQVMFTSINLDTHIPDVLLEPDAPPGQFRSVRAGIAPGSEAPTGEAPWHVGSVPAGFELSARKLRLARDGETSEQLVYSDGIASVSVFVETRGRSTEPMRGGSRIGSVHAYSTVVDGHQVTVVGEVPHATVRRMARSVRPREIGR